MTHEGEGLFGLGGRRLLVVEDNCLCADAVRGWLEICGASVATVGSIDAALDRLRNETPDLLLVDLHLPDGSGWELIERARASVPAVRSVPAVAITGFPLDVTTARRHGVQHVITKPIAPEALADALCDCLAA
ncbi:MAG TPA: response regulator [Candidatus Binatia bacterium]|nr:response regulator [Candidatus Binatia bacterium]